MQTLHEVFILQLVVVLGLFHFHIPHIVNRRNRVIAMALRMLCARVPSYGTEPEVVKIGFAGPLTCPGARVGKELPYGAQLALDEENALTDPLDMPPAPGASQEVGLRSPRGARGGNIRLMVRRRPTTRSWR